MSDRIVGRGLAALVALAAMAFLAMGVPRAEAATVVNGNFETGTLSGWSVFNTEPPNGSWFAYSGTTNPVEPMAPPIQPPPQGNFAAITAQDGAGTHILFQDIALEPGGTHALALTVYYESDYPIFVPEPDTFDYDGELNQQYRIDVIRPTAPILTLDPADILATLFRTREGDPEELDPLRVSADLTPFAGQTVRLRMAEVDNVGPLSAGVDDVVVTTSGLPAPVPIPTSTPAPSNAFTFGKLKLNKKKGTATLKVKVPGAGKLTAVDAKKKAPKRIKKATATATAADTVTLKLKATGRGKKALKNKGNLRFKVRVTFRPTGGIAATKTFAGKLKQKRAP